MEEVEPETAASPKQEGASSARGEEPSGLPQHILHMAEDQADHIQQIVEEAQESEARRGRETKACPDGRRHLLKGRHDRERDAEVLKIQRMREEHAIILEKAMRDDLPDLVPAGRGYEKKKNKKDVGTTNQELAFLKDIYGKVDGSRDLMLRNKARQSASAMRQRSLSSRLSMSSARSYGFGPLPSQRSSLLHEKKDLLLRLHALVTVEEKMAMQSSNRTTGRSLGNFSQRSGVGSGFMSSSSHRGRPLSPGARSTVSSQASAATFCSRSAPKQHVFTVPRRVPALRLGAR